MTKTSLKIVFFLAFMLSVFVGKAFSEDKKMNVLLLIADDINSWLLGDQNRYAGKVVAPHIRGLAKSGVNFTKAYTASPVCSPSRTAFLSGVAPWKSGHYHNALQVKLSQPLNEAQALAGMFKKAGYTTKGYGKIRHGWDQKEHWDEHIGHKRDPYPPNGPLTSVGKGEQDWGVIHLKEEEMNGTLMANHAIKTLEEDHEKPFFLACGFFNPHMPWYVPQKYFDMFPLDEVTTPSLKEGDLDDVPELGKAVTQGKSSFVDSVMKAGLHQEAVQAYLATTAYVDVQVGRVLKALEKSPYQDNTMVIFISDHGFHLAEKNHWQKATLWEEGTHCLMMMKVPGLTSEGGVSEGYVSLLDLYPTLADVCGLKVPSYLDGRSLRPLLENPSAPWESTAITGLCNKSSPEQPYMSIRHEWGRYTRYSDGQEEFYDTQKDPREWTNQISNPEYAEVVKTLRAKLPKGVKPLPSALKAKKERKKKK